MRRKMILRQIILVCLLLWFPLSAFAHGQEIVVMVAATAISVLVSLIGGIIWIFWKKSDRRIKFIAVIIAIGAAFIPWLLFWESYYYFLQDMLMVGILFALAPILVGLGVFVYLKRRAHDN